MTLSSAVSPDELDELCVDTLRFLALDMVQKANSGHPGLPMGAAAMSYALWDRSLKFNPHHPLWPDRDRFVRSAGHRSTLVYGLLRVTGFNLSLDELKSVHQWESRTTGHLEYGKTPEVETTTGPLGQGSENAVGMAIAEVALATRFSRTRHPIADHYFEACTSLGWNSYVGPQIAVIGVDHFGASALGHGVMRNDGFTVENDCEQTQHPLKLVTPKGESR